MAEEQRSSLEAPSLGYLDVTQELEKQLPKKAYGIAAAIGAAARRAVEGRRRSSFSFRESAAPS